MIGEGRPGARCPRCGHMEILHRSNAITQYTPIDGPVPCYAVVDREEIRHPTDAPTWKYTYCGCPHYEEERDERRLPDLREEPS